MFFNVVKQSLSLQSSNFKHKNKNENLILEKPMMLFPRFDDLKHIIAIYSKCMKSNSWNPNMSEIWTLVSLDFRHPYVSKNKLWVRIADISQKCLNLNCFETETVIECLKSMIFQISDAHCNHIVVFTVFFLELSKPVNLVWQRGRSGVRICKFVWHVYFLVWGKWFDPNYFNLKWVVTMHFHWIG